MEAPSIEGVSPAPPSPSLADLLGTLGPHVLHHLATPEVALGTTVSDPVLHDREEALAPTPGGILLAIGSRASTPEAVQVVQAAAAAGYAGVVIKAHGTPATSGLAEAASAAGVALLLAPDELPWRHLDALITAATGASSPASDTYASVGIGDLFALANVIASSVGGAVTIEDPRGQVLAYSNLPHHEIDEIRKLAILGLRTPERPGNQDEYRKIALATGPVRFTELGPGHTDRLAIAVRAGHQQLGVVFVIDGTPPLPVDAAQKLEEAATVTALHLLRARRNRDPDRRNRGEALRALLDASLPTDVSAAQLNIGLDTPIAVLAIAQTGASASRGVASARIVDLVTMHCEAWHPDAVCAVAHGVIYALVPAPSDGALDRLVRFGREVATTVDRSAQLGIHVAVGPIGTLDTVSAARQTTDRILRAMAQVDHQVVATVDDVQVPLALLELAERGAAGDESLLSPLRRMLAHDERHNSDYAVTLLGYLDHFGEVAPAAARLNIHENTLRYRLRRLNELFGLDLDGHDARLVVWLQLRLLAQQSRLPGL
ncbi:PucR family transcriptional regulator [Egicoccus sp. AB-alg6-2]|uniref:PucR family transcriptional regulator n=1 Tax=Egicoccus sp. AB-alg6-2 TaxID=3242692 RepID=UPI00359EF6F7